MRFKALFEWKMISSEENIGPKIVLAIEASKTA